MHFSGVHTKGTHKAAADTGMRGGVTLHPPVMLKAAHEISQPTAEERAPVSERFILNGHIASAPPVQRTIKWSSTNRRLQTAAAPITNRTSLAAAVQACFPLIPQEQIDVNILKIEADREEWSLTDIYNHFARLSGTMPVPLTEEEKKEDTLLPTKVSERRNYAFTTRTRLRAKILSGGKTISLPQFTQDKGGHAEDYLQAHLRDMLKEDGKATISSGVLIITINNSPCYERCAPRLIAFKKTVWPGRIVIRYANPHGSDEAFIAARENMQAAGIELQSFNPDERIAGSDLRPADQQRFAGMKKRRRRLRKTWNDKHPDEHSSDSDNDPKGDDEKSGAKDHDIKAGKKKRRGTVSMAVALHNSVQSEAVRMGASNRFRIGYADGTDNNCAIISIFGAAGVPLSRQRAMEIRTQLHTTHQVPLEGNLDIERDGLAQQILSLVSTETRRSFRLLTVQERDGGIVEAEVASTGSGENIYILFAGAHFSPAFLK